MKTLKRMSQMNSVLSSAVDSTGKNLGLGLVMLSSIAMMACAPKNARLVSPSEAPVSITDVRDVNRKAVSDPKVDVLFVIDTSDSMSVHQENLKKNVGRFVEAFEANKNVDFHIGVVSIFDSHRYGTEVPAGKFYPLGQLRPLKDPAHPGQAVAGAQFVTRTDGYAAILGASLEVGIEERCGGAPGTLERRACKIDLGGPEFEESFSPVMSALNGQNAGFYRSDAHLAVIFVTDANDDSQITPDSLTTSLMQLKGNDSSKLSTYGVLSLDKCEMDPSGPPTKIVSFLENTGGRAYNLCADNFGDQLAVVGKQIQAKASSLSIPLSVLPSKGTIVVKYGEQLVPNDEAKGWILDTSGHSIILSPDAELNGPAGTKITITYIAVDATKIGTDKVRNAH